MLVPSDFDVPMSYAVGGFRLEPLGPEHNDRDHLAWMSSIDHIRSTPGFGSRAWPVPMSLEQNLEDVVRHVQDFERRKGFTYSILEGEDVVGCVYIYPSSEPAHDAEVRSWVRKGRAELDPVVWRAVSDWLEAAWPFSNPYYAARV